MNKKLIMSLAVFLAIFYGGLWAGSWIMNTLGASVTDPMLIAGLGVAIPGTIVFFVWTKWGKDIAD